MINKNRLSLLTLIALICLLTLSACGAPDVQSSPAPDVSAQSSPNVTAAGSAEAQPITCSITVECKTIVESHPDLAASVSDNGIILAEQQLELQAGATVYDALVASGLSFHDAAGYVTTIQALSEKDCGEQSGWMFTINGELAAQGHKDTILQEGDQIAWLYSCDYGADLGFTF